MPNIFESVIRADDFLHCQFEFVNLVLRTSGTGAQRLERAAAGPAFIVLRMAPQSIAEQVVSADSLPDFPYKGALAGPSRLTCRLPDDRTHVDYRLDALLDQIRTAELVLDDHVAVGEQATVIEFPDRLLLAPKSSAPPFHRTKPFTARGVTEIWNTTLGNSAPGTSIQFRAIENPSDVSTRERPFEASLSKANRDDIVEHCRRNSDPHVIGSSLFRLTALGATAKLKGNWNPVPEISLAAWEHQAELGRDYYVYTLEQGFLFPFCHPATIATVKERRFASHLGVQAAELAQTRKFLRILDVEHVYHSDDDDRESPYPGRGREMPFARVCVASAPREISDNNAPIPVDLVLADIVGNVIHCSTRVFFVAAGPAATDEISLAALRERYAELSVVSLDSQRVAMAGLDDTSVNVESLTFGVKLPSELRRPLVPGFLPFVVKADAKLPALEQMLGTSAGATAARQRRVTSIEFHPRYLEQGFPSGDRKQVFAKFAKIADGIVIPAERAGGLAAPKFPALDGLSRLSGPVADVDGLVNGTPLTARDLVLDSKLLGMIPLSEMIEDATGRDPFPIGDALQLFDKVDTDAELFLPRPVLTTIGIGAGAETRFVWKPRIKAALPEPLKRLDNMDLILKGKIVKGVPPALTVIGRLRNFELSFDLLAIQFNALEFTSNAGRKLDVNLDVRGISFGGALNFVQKLLSALPVGDLAGGPSIQTQPDGVVVRYAIPVPSLPLGALSIQNIAVSTSVSLPFVAGKAAAVRFALSERNNPFQITVSIFGGTGFFAIEVFTDKRVQIEAALEFGGIAALNLVVVKGGVFLLAGIYLAMKPDGGLLIEGHLRLGGFVDVLGLISVSIEVYIALTYIADRNVLFGTGRLTVGIKLLFFSESFSFEVTKEIPGFGEAPTDTIMLVAAAPVSAAPPAAAGLRRTALGAPDMTASQWMTYCSAFA